MTDTEVANDIITTVAVVLKGGAGTITVDKTKLPDEVYDAIFVKGLEHFLQSKGMSKILPGITKLEGTELATRQALVLKQAQVNLEALYSGELGAAKAPKAKAVQAEIQPEAMPVQIEIQPEAMPVQIEPVADLPQA